MLEHIVQMGPMLILAGLAVGWIAEAVTRAGGYGSTSDMALALVGSAVAGLTVWLGTSGGAGMATMFLIGCGGAVLLIAAQRSMWRGPGLGT
jgi:uncharacterized membrane protein YeaQ/YmgE (transglycosylase-associated protein family)